MCISSCSNCLGDFQLLTFGLISSFQDEGIGSPVEEDFEDMRRGIVDVRQQLDKEKRIRMLLEEQVIIFNKFSPLI